jgi:hypothetical protein
MLTAFSDVISVVDLQFIPTCSSINSSQEILRFYGSRIQSRMNEVHILTPCAFYDFFNIIFPSTLTFPMWSFLYGVPPKIIYVFLIS